MEEDNPKGAILGFFVMLFAIIVLIVIVSERKEEFIYREAPQISTKDNDVVSSFLQKQDSLRRNSNARIENSGVGEVEGMDGLPQREFTVGKPLFSLNTPAIMPRNVGQYFDSDSKYDKYMGDVEATIREYGSVENYRAKAQKGEFVDGLKEVFTKTWWLIIVGAVILVVYKSRKHP